VVPRGKNGANQSGWLLREGIFLEPDCRGKKARGLSAVGGFPQRQQDSGALETKQNKRRRISMGKMTP